MKVVYPVVVSLRFRIGRCVCTLSYDSRTHLEVNEKVSLYKSLKLQNIQEVIQSSLAVNLSRSTLPTDWGIGEAALPSCKCLVCNLCMAYVTCFTKGGCDLVS